MKAKRHFRTNEFATVNVSDDNTAQSHRADIVKSNAATASEAVGKKKSTSSRITFRFAFERRGKGHEHRE